MESKICPWCTGPVAPKPGRGRPPVYCSDQCRRYAYEHRRAAQRESQPVRIIVEKTPPQVIERTRRAWSRPDPNALAEALEEHPDLAAPVLRRMVELATNERLSNRARTALGAHLARFTAELFTARFAFNPRPATTTGRVITAEQWGSGRSSRTDHGRRTRPRRPGTSPHRPRGTATATAGRSRPARPGHRLPPRPGPRPRGTSPPDPPPTQRSRSPGPPTSHPPGKQLLPPHLTD